MRFSQFSEGAMDDTIRIMQKTFSPERKAVQDEVLKLARAVEMGKDDKMMLARAITELTKSELEVKRSDPDLKVSVDQNLNLLKRAMDKLSGVTESIGDIAELDETEVVKILRSKKSTGSLRNQQALAPVKIYSKPGSSKNPVKTIDIPKQLDLFNSKAVANESSDIDEFDFFDNNIHSIEDLENYNWDSLSNEEIKDLLRYAEVMYRAQDYNGDEELKGYFSAAENFLDNLLAQRQGNVSESLEALTEAEFDEAAGEKDACYRKVKSRYKVWPSAYASGALVKCRKVGAANWGNSKKK